MTQGKTDSAVIDASCKIYETSLAFYPDDLRSEFGEEMVEVFEEQLSDAYGAQGIRGFLRIWLCTVREFVTIAVTGQLARCTVPVLAVATAFVLMIWLAGFMAPPAHSVDKLCGR